MWTIKKMTDRKSLRHTLITNRNQLSSAELNAHAQQLVSHFKNNPLFLAAEHIAFYSAIQHELSLTELMQLALQLNKSCYLPIMEPRSKTLRFYSYQPGDELLSNHVHIAEPDHNTAQEIAPRDLDLVLLPTVGWDHHGNRLGMGAGYYDRTFAFMLSEERIHHRPWLIGIAHEVQYSPLLDAMPWDVWMVGIATEKKYYAVIGTEQLK
jgi:5-formyltetrahydrofolate cyclo-ligase